jgi:hypothetical protein
MLIASLKTASLVSGLQAVRITYICYKGTKQNGNRLIFLSISCALELQIPYMTRRFSYPTEEVRVLLGPRGYGVKVNKNKYSNFTAILH